MSERFVIVHLTDPTHKLPIPGAHRFFSAADEGEKVDAWDPFFHLCLVDGSLTAGPRPAPPEPVDEPKTTPPVESD
jgi:hypothetical protein